MHVLDKTAKGSNKKQEIHIFLFQALTCMGL